MIKGFRLINHPKAKWVFVHVITDTWKEVLVMKEFGGFMTKKIDETVIFPVSGRFQLGLESDLAGHLSVTVEPTDVRTGKLTLIRADAGQSGHIISHHISDITVKALIKLKP